MILHNPFRRKPSPLESHALRVTEETVALNVREQELQNRLRLAQLTQAEERMAIMERVERSSLIIGEIVWSRENPHLAGVVAAITGSHSEVGYLVNWQTGYMSHCGAETLITAEERDKAEAEGMLRRVMVEYALQTRDQGLFEAYTGRG
jgi:hypothetical protein